ncbi:MAG TPA: hypothetical protein VEM41_09945 [Actinomycetota bacterium]|nr:hypothetical protein [Actinomycetota bacterium]
MTWRRTSTAARLIGPVALLALLTSCAGAFAPATSPHDGSPARPPGPGTVRHSRFVVPVELDNGRLFVEPAPTSMRPTFPQSRAAAEIWADPAVAGGGGDTVFGFGLVTTRVSAPDVVRVRRVPAWIGFSWGRVVLCPMEPIASNRPSPTALPSNGYVAVVVGANDGVPAFTYTARSAFCGRRPTGPSVTLATKTLSIPWHPVGHREGTTLAIAFRLPPCGQLVSTSVAGESEEATIEVDATTPDEPLPCPAPVTRTARVDVGSASVIRHAPLGPVPRTER